MVDLESSVRSWLSAWPIGAVLRVSRTPTGTIHRVYCVETPEAVYYLRIYHYGERAAIDREHAVIAHVARHGLPVVLPLRTRAGTTLTRRQNTYAALFPAAPGRLVAASPGRVGDITLGEMLARTHLALANYPQHLVARRDYATNTAATLREISRFEALISAIADPSESDRFALNGLQAQRAWLAHAVRPEPQQASEQPIHGDYTLANLFAEHGRIVAIIDWDQIYMATRGWEIIRALDLVLGYEPQRCAAFVEGYRRTLTLPIRELDAAAAAYGWMRAHDLWKYAAVYDQGNDRVRAFFGPQGFEPHEHHWRAVRESLLESE